MKAQTFTNPTTGVNITSCNKAEIKKMKACCWKKVKPVRVFYARETKDGNNFLN